MYGKKAAVASFPYPADPGSRPAFLFLHSTGPQPPTTRPLALLHWFSLSWYLQTSPAPLAAGPQLPAAPAPAQPCLPPGTFSLGSSTPPPPHPPPHRVVLHRRHLGQQADELPLQRRRRGGQHLQNHRHLQAQGGRERAKWVLQDRSRGIREVCSACNLRRVTRARRFRLHNLSDALEAAAAAARQGPPWPPQPRHGVCNCLSRHKPFYTHTHTHTGTHAHTLFRFVLNTRSPAASPPPR